MRASERREDVIRAGIRAFGARGYAGTTTQSIAEQVSVSQPYLFRLFETKKSLFIAVVREGFERYRTALEATARASTVRTPEAILAALRRTCAELAVDGDLLRVQLQAYAACDDPDIRAVVRQERTILWQAVGRWSGADDAALQAWFGQAMSLIVAAAVGDPIPGVSAPIPVGDPDDGSTTQLTTTDVWPRS